ncbi:global transcriptional regulator BolA [Shewanella colwelliana]|uniref:DNA-binding transcriptional regulator BolA n=1 Tax=Shewanella colwelliana TaxID=23 RepID=A0A1E5IU88_SHECO|nr:BolA family protein [Shewanella colwelliana]MDX1283099.1 BolA family protein [Shewanella colwelliana]OEG73638.1 transcriptional regulator [Shewanella colwelliana]GIU24811.1 global transcriptional regulator BolA [Shewanella colwelliana]GIU44028.1 global transcriptional regulator BolA [Shewanella colwelliana]
MSVEQNITEKLTAALSPVHLEVINESDNHHVPPNSETHFKVIIASEAFEGKRLIGRHRSVNEALADEFAQGLHALSMHTFTPSEWQAEGNVPDSPKCKG